MPEKELLKFGIVLPSYGVQAGRSVLLDAAQAAEDLGYDSLWLTDHIALPEADAERFGHIFEVISTMGYLAGYTHLIRLGISALILSQRNPIIVAKEIASLDVLSGGRIMLAIGAGWSAGEFANLGVPFSERGKRTDEGIRVLRALWNGDQVSSFTGQYYQYERLVFSPGPFQAGGPPIWVGGGSKAALRRAALLADGWHPNAHGPQALQAETDFLRPLLDSRPFTISLRIRCDFSHPANDGIQLFGSPREIVQVIKAYQAAGMNYAILNFTEESQTARQRSIRIFAEEVIPLLHIPG